MQPEIGVVIAAGGSGERAGFETPKQFRAVAGVPLLLRSLRPFASREDVLAIAVVLPKEYVAQPPDFLADLTGERLQLVAGGSSRAASVRSGFEAIRAKVSAFMVHDAARPFVSSTTIDACVACLVRGFNGVAAVPMADTVKEVSVDGVNIARTVDRSALWRAQTPQAVQVADFERALGHLSSNEIDKATDEAQLLELAGIPVQVVTDLASNFKLTTPADFEMAERILS